MNNGIKKRVVSLVLVLAMAVGGVVAFPGVSSANEPFLGEIKIFPFGFAPKGWALCNGQLLPINQNQALFSLLGTTYGGDGITTFALPDLRGRVAVHSGMGITLGQVGGAEQHTLSINELPNHMHPIPASLLPGTTNTMGDNTYAALAQTLDRRPINMYGSAATEFIPGLTNVGGGQPHHNMQPYLVLNFSIALHGIYPSPN